jgi:replication initiation and membrane attachment protein
MINVDSQFNATLPFKVEKQGNTQISNLPIFTDLYLPLIGSDAFSLYAKLFTYQENNLTNHIDLADLLGITLDELVVARQNLEAFELIETYKINYNNENLYSYQLNQPLTNKQFFNNQFFSQMLFHQIGESLYNQLKIKYTENEKTGINISAKFNDVFDFHIEDNNSDLKINLINSKLVSSYKMNPDSVAENQKLINDLHNMYSLNEEEIIKVILDALNIEDRTINTEQAYLIARGENTPQISSNTNPNSVSSIQLDTRQASIVKEARSRNNTEFLSLMKKTYKGNPLTVEIRAIEALTRNNVPSDVINILIFQSVNSNPQHQFILNWTLRDLDYLIQNNADKNAELAIQILSNRDSKTSTTKKTNAKGIEYGETSELSDEEVNAIKERILNRINNGK